MLVRSTIDKAGRVIIPKSFRDELRLQPGDALDIESIGERITLRPVRGSGALVKELGVWVLRTGQTIPSSATDDLLTQLRRERENSHLGLSE